MSFSLHLHSYIDIEKTLAEQPDIQDAAQCSSNMCTLCFI